MKNVIKLLLPLFFLAAIACSNPESSSSSAQETAAVPAAMEKEAILSTSKSVEKKEDTIATKATSTTDETTITMVKEVGDKKQLSKVKKPKATVQGSSKSKEKPAKPSVKEVKMPTPSSQKPSPAAAPVTSTKAKEVTKEVITPSKKAQVQATPKKVEKEVKEFTHEAWDALLKANVSSNGKVNYSGFKNKQAALDAYLESLKNNPPEFSRSRNEKLAFWINAYNAFTIKLIVDNYPVSSITKLHGGKPWDAKWVKIGTKTYSLNNIENDIIRPTFKEPRIHFAVNCAAQSCPPLLNRAWTANNLNRNFEKQTKAFINNSKYNNITASGIQISKIFEWYAADFGNLIDFLNKYVSTKIETNAKINYKEYDWALNN